MPKTYPEPPHGTLRRYQSVIYRCRCQECTTANTNAWKEEKRRRIARLAADPTIIKHGTYNGYHNWGCRCDPCMNAAINRRRIAQGLPPRTDNPIRERKGGVIVRPAMPKRKLPRAVITPTPTDMPDLFNATRDKGSARTPRRRVQPFGREWLDAV